MASSSTFRKRDPEAAGESIEMKNTTYKISETRKDKPIVDTDNSDYREDEQWVDLDHDLRDMRRLGKKQEFKRNFNFISTLGFVSIYMATWEFVLVSLSVGFANGGFGGLFWCFITTVTCYSTIVASLAEMTSMAPTTGGQYRAFSSFFSADQAAR